MSNWLHAVLSAIVVEVVCLLSDDKTVRAFGFPLAMMIYFIVLELRGILKKLEKKA